MIRNEYSGQLTHNKSSNVQKCHEWHFPIGRAQTADKYLHALRMCGASALSRSWQRAPMRNPSGHAGQAAPTGTMNFACGALCIERNPKCVSPDSAVRCARHPNCRDVPRASTFERHTAFRMQRSRAMTKPPEEPAAMVLRDDHYEGRPPTGVDVS
jgi:hypothetical protein